MIFVNICVVVVVRCNNSICFCNLMEICKIAMETVMWERSHLLWKDTIPVPSIGIKYNFLWSDTEGLFRPYTVKRFGIGGKTFVIISDWPFLWHTNCRYSFLNMWMVVEHEVTREGNGWDLSLVRPGTYWQVFEVPFILSPTNWGCLINIYRVPHGSVVKCLTCNPGVLGSSRTCLSVFSSERPWARHFRAQPSTGETKERHE